LARERAWLLAWDDNHWLYIFNQAGGPEAQRRMPNGVTTACCADDGSAFAALGALGEVWWLAPDLTPRWHRSLPARGVAAAMDPFGQLLAVADTRATLHIYDRAGEIVSQMPSARPFHHLAFVPAAPFVVGSSDFGLVGCIDLQGRWAWREGLVLNAGGLSVSGAGELIALACFSEGIHCYDLAGRRRNRLPLAEPCRLVSVSFDGQSILTTGLTNRLTLLDPSGRVVCLATLEKPAVGLALAPLADTAFIALTDGRVLGMTVEQDG
jgi:hypothetical protein